MDVRDLPLDLDQIPTRDGEAALAFCRALQQVFLNRNGAHTATEPAPELSVVVPVYNEEENVDELYQRLSASLEGLGASYEIILVNDGSADGTTGKLQNIAEDDQNVTIVELARNFGQQVAFSAGLDFSRGEAVVVMDGDLQDPPEAIAQLFSKWREGYDVVYGVRVQRKENFFKRKAYALYYRILRAVADIDIPLDAGDFCIMSRRIVTLLNRMPERNRFIRGIRSWVGYRQIGIPIERSARNAGEPKYTFRRLVNLALDGLVSFSVRPLRFISLMGISVSMLSIGLAVFYTVKRALYGLHPPGFATLVVMICFFAGVQLITIGVIGEYIGKIFHEVKNRPLYVVRRVHGSRFECES